MAIDCSCDVCGKHYKLVDKLAGKKVRCKACGENFTVPTVSDLVVSSPHPAARATSTASSQRHDQPSSDLGLRPAISDDDKYCPQCGNGIRKNYVVCTNCGYNTRTGDSGRTIVERPAETVVVSNAQQARPRYNDDAERRYDGTRVNNEYRNGFAGLMEMLCVKGAMLLVVLMFLAPVILGIIVLGYGKAPAKAWGAFIGATFMQTLLGLIGLAINVWFNTTAVNIAGKLMMFETPDELGLRVLASKIWASMVALPFVLVGALATGAFASATSGPDGASPGAAIAAMLGFVIVALVFMLAAQVFFTWFLLRLRFLEAIVTFLFICLADIVSFVVVGGLFFVIGLLFGAIGTAIKGS